MDIEGWLTIRSIGFKIEYEATTAWWHYQRVVMVMRVSGVTGVSAATKGFWTLIGNYTAVDKSDLILLPIDENDRWACCYATSWRQFWIFFPSFSDLFFFSMIFFHLIFFSFSFLICFSFIFKLNNKSITRKERWKYPPVGDEFGFLSSKN